MLKKLFCLSPLLMICEISLAQQNIAEYFERKTTDPIQIGIPSGQYFPSNIFVNIDNEEVLFKDENYQLTIVNFWFKACKSCISEKVSLKKLTEHYKDNQKVRFISITPTDNAGIEKTIKKYGNTNYDVISLGSFKSVEEQFHFKGYPRHAILNNEGKVLAQYITSIPNDEFLQEFIKRIDGFLYQKN